MLLAGRVPGWAIPGDGAAFNPWVQGRMDVSFGTPGRRRQSVAADQSEIQVAFRIMG
jgi:hypothetical protein